MFLLGILGLIALNTRAFNISLQPEEVQEAYSLGQTTNHEELADFLKQYEHKFESPADNSIAYAQSVEFETPYEQIVLRTHRTVDYTKFQASEDYRADPGLVIVRAVVSLKNGYHGPEPAAESFKITVSQMKNIEPRMTESNVICNPYLRMDAHCVVFTRAIFLQFNASQFGPGKATVTVILPEGQSVETKYNVEKLK